MFQSTPPCGGRREGKVLHQHCCCFNPRPRAGGDVNLISNRVSTAVSIHAPVRGATTPQQTKVLNMLFQSTPPCGGRLVIRSPPATMSVFQSTPPCGGRLSSRFRSE